MAGACSTQGEKINAYRTYRDLVGKPDGKRQLERRMWEDNIKICLSRNMVGGLTLD
jgi:hypothetical protein